MHLSVPDGFRRPPRLSPLTSIGLGLTCVISGWIIQGGLGGALTGAGVGCVLFGAWDGFRLAVGLVDEVFPPPQRDPCTSHRPLV
jgi:hypothetical protein